MYLDVRRVCTHTEGITLFVSSDLKVFCIKINIFNSFYICMYLLFYHLLNGDIICLAPATLLSV